MGRIVCIANQKGGVGKTTTAVNLAAVLARARKRSLVIDLDPQCNATSALGAKPAARHALLGEAPLAEACLPTKVPRLDLLPGCRSFQDVDALARGDEPHSGRLRSHLLDGLASYDWVLIDCPPSLGQLTQTALSAAHEVLIPIQCEYFAMEGLTQMIQVIRNVMQRSAGRLEFGGILLTMYDDRLELTHEVDSEVRDFFGEIVFDSVIPRDPLVAEAPSHGQDILDYAPRSVGARAYMELCLEVLERE